VKSSKPNMGRLLQPTASKALTTADGRARDRPRSAFTRVEFREYRPMGILADRHALRQSLVIRLHYRANEPIERPAFAFTMYTNSARW